MKFMKTCGCEIDYREVPSQTGTSSDHLEEVPVSFCEIHKYKPSREDSLITD